MHCDIDQAEELLLKWAESMRAPEDEGLGYPVKASGGFTHSWIKDFEEMADDADAEEIIKIHAAVNSLHMSHQEVIAKRHRIGRPLVWKWGNESVLYDQAKKAFRIIYFTRGNRACNTVLERI